MEKDPYKEILEENFDNNAKPTSDFTSNVMFQINELVTTEKVIKPLISMKVWWVISLIYGSIFIIPLIFGIQENAYSFLENLNLSNSSSIILKENLQLIFNLLFVIGVIVLGDTFLKSRKVWS